MVTEDYSFNVTYLQDLGFALWTPGRTGPLLLLGRGRFALLGLFFIYGLTYGCLFLNPISIVVGYNSPRIVLPLHSWLQMDFQLETLYFDVDQYKTHKQHANMIARHSMLANFSAIAGSIFSLELPNL